MLKSKQIEFLREVRGLLTNPSAWTKGTTGRRASGVPCDSDDIGAVSWCLVGACYKVARDNADPEPVMDSLRGTLFLAPECFTTGLVNFNDYRETKHKDVLGLIDKTIARLEE